MFHAWCTGNDRVRRFGCREIKVPSSPLFVNTVYRHVVLVISYYCAPEFIIDGIFSLLTRLLSEDYITHVTHHAALPMPPQRRHFCIEMALRLHLKKFNRQVCYSA